MKFGVRECVNVIFRAKSKVKIGQTDFQVGQPVLYIDSAKMSTLEGAATAVYATGGRGNTRLVTWEGEKTLTFTVEDALISPMGLSILSGAGLIKGEDNELVHVHKNFVQIIETRTVASAEGGETTQYIINLTEALGDTETICETAPLFVCDIDGDGGLSGKILNGATVVNIASGEGVEKENYVAFETVDESFVGKAVMVDCYINKVSSTVSEIQIDAENFAGYYYVEGETLFRRQIDGVDAPVAFTLPNVKIQSNFNFSMASTGDPSTFTFTMDAMPGYTYFNKTKKVLCVMQIIEDAAGSTTTWASVMGHAADEKIDIDGDTFDDNSTEDTDAADSIVQG